MSTQIEATSLLPRLPLSSTNTVHFKMKFTSAVLAIAMMTTSSTLAAKQDRRKTARVGGRALGKGSSSNKGKGGKGGKGKGGCGKGDADKCPEGKIYVEYEIKFDEDFDRDVEDSPGVVVGCELPPALDISIGVFLLGGRTKVGCVNEDRPTWSLELIRNCEGSYLDEYIEEIKFCIDGTSATWPEDCEEDGCDDPNRSFITFRSSVEEDERVIEIQTENGVACPIL